MDMKHMKFAQDESKEFVMPKFKHEPAACPTKVKYEVRCDNGRSDRKCDWIHQRADGKWVMQVKTPKCVADMHMQGKLKPMHDTIRHCNDVPKACQLGMNLVKTNCKQEEHAVNLAFM